MLASLRSAARRRVRAVDARQPAREVDARDRRRVHVGRVERVPRAVDLAHDHVGDRAADSRGRRRRSQPRPYVRRPRSRRAAASSGGAAVDREDAGHDRGRHVRAGRARPPQLLHHDGLLDQARVVDVQDRSSPVRTSASQNSGRVSCSASSAARSTCGVMRVATNRLTASRRCSCSSVIPIGIPHRRARRRGLAHPP